MLTAVRNLPQADETDFAELRAREFARLDAQDCAYLDYTGAALYPERLLTTHTSLLRSSILGNPHAESPTSLASTGWITEARERVLGFLDADPSAYAVCFTANATAAIGLVASAFRFGSHASLVLSADNHNSVNGIREYARRASAMLHTLPLDAEMRLDRPEERLAAVRRHYRDAGLFAYPAQSNFSGVQHPLSLVREAQSLGFRVLVDAAALLPTMRMSLRTTPADFVALSFYKMFGYPTGLGALVARRDALAELNRPWFSGGTVEYVSVQNLTHLMKGDESAFEDGTANFLAIAAVPAGLDWLEGLGMPDVAQHASGLATALVNALAGRHHRNGAPIARVYGPRGSVRRGATVAFNLLDDRGGVIPYARVEERAARARVSVRGGCFCNPGASEAAFGFSATRAARCQDSRDGERWTLSRFAQCMQGHAVGAVRASFGAPSNVRDLSRLLDVVESFSA
jgi:selenocysteine lyase/cysteine desulfurase